MNNDKHSIQPKDFTEHWEGKGNEKGESQSFWLPPEMQIRNIHTRQLICQSPKSGLSEWSYDDDDL